MTPVEVATTEDENAPAVAGFDVTVAENRMTGFENRMTKDENRMTRNENAMTGNENRMTEDENDMTEKENSMTTYGTAPAVGEAEALGVGLVSVDF